MKTIAELFWEARKRNTKLTQFERYEAAGSPESIKRFIAIGGGPKMGVTMEEYARFQFPRLKKRLPGKDQTGYDHVFRVGEESATLYCIEQKSSGHWGQDDFKWQHVEEKHNWHFLLLCGIGYTDVRFWMMNRATFSELIAEGKITNQGNKQGDSTEGRWFYYSEVKDSLVEVATDADIETFVLIHATQPKDMHIKNPGK